MLENVIMTKIQYIIKFDYALYFSVSILFSFSCAHLNT